MRKFILWLIRVFKVDIVTVKYIDKEIVKEVNVIDNSEVNGDVLVKGNVKINGTMTVTGGLCVFGKGA